MYIVIKSKGNEVLTSVRISIEISQGDFEGLYIMYHTKQYTKCAVFGNFPSNIKQTTSNELTMQCHDF